jgi:hypothetical protein
MDEVSPDVVAVNVHAGAAHVEGIVTTAGSTGILRGHGIIFRGLKLPAASCGELQTLSGFKLVPGAKLQKGKTGTPLL